MSVRLTDSSALPQVGHANKCRAVRPTLVVLHGTVVQHSTAERKARHRP